MGLGPAKLLLDVALAPLRIGARIVGGVLGGGDTHPGIRLDDPPTAPAAERRGGAGPQRSSEPKPWLDDVALARKVETTIFRDRDVAKGKIDVNAAEGVVWLRGEAKTPDLIKRLEEQTRAIPEVRQVENLLHLPKTPAPSRSDTPASQRKTRRSSRAPRQRKVAPRKVTAEKQARKGEASPAQRASGRRGRGAAPLGSEEPKNDER